MINLIYFNINKNHYNQATGIGVFLVYPPGQKYYENTPPGNLGHSRSLILTYYAEMNFIYIIIWNKDDNLL